MIDNELQGLLEQASETGARRALARLGLDDASAAKDMGELRELLSAWRDAKRSARKAAIGWIVRMVLALLLIGLAVRLGLPGLVSQCGWLAMPRSLMRPSPAAILSARGRLRGRRRQVCRCCGNMTSAAASALSRA